MDMLQCTLLLWVLGSLVEGSLPSWHLVTAVDINHTIQNNKTFVTLSARCKAYQVVLIFLQTHALGVSDAFLFGDVLVIEETCSARLCGKDDEVMAYTSSCMCPSPEHT